MAKPPLSPDVLIEQFGPHLNYTPPGGWRNESTHPAEKLVKIVPLFGAMELPAVAYLNFLNLHSSHHRG